jgi:LacI family transcriptional regulator
VEKIIFTLLKQFDFMKRITIIDIAKMLSVNPSTVSRALADHKDVSSETKRKVRECAEQFNYIPNLHARFFRLKKSTQIALILPEVNMFFTPSLLNGLYAATEENGLSVVVFYSSNNLIREQESIKKCLSWAVDGVIIICSDETKDDSHLQDLVKAHIPVVLLDKVVDSDICQSVTIVDFDIAFNCCNILINKGCKSILAMFSSARFLMSQKRKKGVNEACTRSNISLENVHIEDVSSIEKTIMTMDLSKFDGIFVMSDEILFYLVGALRRIHFDINKIKISAISDGILPKNLGFDIDFVHHSGYEMGHTAVQRLIDQFT